MELVLRIAVFAIPVIFAVTLHEAAHGWVASRLGDPTAKELGRLSMNPLRHVDPIGTVVVPLVLLFAGGLIFGWAKPVPVNMARLGEPRRDMALVALAGPGSNLIMGIGWAFVIKAATLLPEGMSNLGLALLYMGQAGVIINAVLMVLNLFPLPPLDGGRVLVSALPPPLARKVSRVEPFGIVIVLVLLLTGLLGQMLGPPLDIVQRWMYLLAGLAPWGA